MPSCDEKSPKLADFLNQNNELPNVFVACGKVIVSQSLDESSCSSCTELKDLVEKSRKRKHMLSIKIS